ncbi:cysteine/O-acetylserine efflux protein [Desulfatibacillum alkenivorans DSM 16219]|jgi:cysteine/O-acetylserine efflux protein|uniref:Cysteine/O-acetylserine efflux protein n=1 Tax=Desulfatibacillum alkenivorans DSM 16219 TaxID=1121393 RepID=A0A1M6YD69_9BACT|nr:LysE family transporter [Desulfatibacillum alkenivorans]SHL15955.1 cysteine/O-acetylserine efflux protein [Desulfatibacillum alkenivorans DSM 16219]
MGVEFFPLASFVAATTFTPGPNNISSASMGVLYGYRKTLPYLTGIALGFLPVQLLSALASSTVLSLLPSVEPVLRLLGAAYILWLAYGTLRVTYDFSHSHQPVLGFKKGFFFQIVNPKGVIYGLTLYSTFLAPAADQPLFLCACALAFSVVAFCSVTSWALCGAAVKEHLKQPKIKNAVNIFLALLLVYCAVDLSGLIF